MNFDRKNSPRNEYPYNYLLEFGDTWFAFEIKPVRSRSNPSILKEELLIKYFKNFGL